MNVHSLRLLSIVLPTVLVPHLWAEDAVPPATPTPQPTSAAQPGDSIVVTAPQQDPGIGASVAGEPVVTVSREQALASPSIGVVGDALNRVPGVYMDGPSGRNKETHLRGVSASFSRVTVDGLDVPDGNESRQFQLDRLSLFAIGGMTVVRNQTAAMESDGMVGRVDVALRPIPQQRTLDAAVAGGFRDEFDGQKSWRASLGGGERLSENFGYQLFADYQQLPINKKKTSSKYDDGDGSLKSSQVSGGETPIRMATVLGDVGIFFDTGELHFRPLFLSTDEDKPKKTYTEKPGDDPTYQDETEDSHSRTYGLSIVAKRLLVGTLRWHDGFAAYRSEDTSHKNKLNYTLEPGNTVFDDQEVENEEVSDRTMQYRGDALLSTTTFLPMEWQAGIQVRVHTRDHELSTVVYEEGEDPADESAPSANYGLTEWYYAFYVQDTITLLPGFRLTPGIRLEQIALSTVSGAGERGDSSTFDANPSLHLAYDLSRQVELHAAASRTLARPDFNQITPFVEEGDDRYVRGNPDLEAAHAWSFDLGGSWNSLDGIALGVNGFYRIVDGLIEEVDTGDVLATLPVYQYESVGDGYIRGIELDQRFGLGVLTSHLSAITLWANQAFLDSEVHAEDGDRPFQLQPDFIASFGVDIAVSQFGTAVHLAAKYLGERSEYAIAERTDYDEEWTFDAGIQQSFGRHFVLRFDAVNLTSTDTYAETTDLASGVVVEKETEHDFRYFSLTCEAHF